MSFLYRKRWELIFLVKHEKGPKMPVDSATKYLKMSRPWGYSVIKQFDDFGHVDFGEDRGGKPATNEKQNQEMVKMALAEKPKTTQQIADVMTKKGVKVSRVTVGRRLKDHNLRYKAMLKKPLLKKVHIERRLMFAQENIDRDWTRVIFSNESTFELCYEATRAWQIRGEPKLSRTVKHPPKVNVWGCFSARGFGKLVIVNGILESTQMVNIYARGLLPSAQKFYGPKSRNWQLLEDKDPKHTSKLSKAWKQRNEVQVLDWPAQSPDLNPIENVWALIKARIRRKKIMTIQGLIRAIRQEWNSLTVEYAQKLAASCVHRCESY